VDAREEREVESGAETDILTRDRRARYQRMVLNEAWLSLATLSILIGLIARQAGLVVLGVILIVVSLIARLWNRYALRGIAYRRELEPRRAFIGETVDLTVIAENRKLLPVGWIRLEDEWPTELSLSMGAEDLHPTSSPQQSVLRNAFSLQWYERVRRHYQIRCDARGYYRLGPVHAVSGDIFGMFRTEQTLPTLNWLVVYPRIVPIEDLGLPPKDPFGEVRAQQRIFEDPSRTIGVRDHQPERCITVAASVCAYAAEKRWGVGLLANGSIPRSDQPIRVLPGRDPQQLTRILEALAAVTPIATQDIAALLEHESPRLPWGATLIVVTANVNGELNSTLLRLRAAGRRLVLISLSEQAPDPLVSEEVLTYHLPDAASPYLPVQTSAARQLTPAARRDGVLQEWTLAGTPAGEGE